MATSSARAPAVDVRRADEPARTRGSAGSTRHHSFSFGQPLRPGQHPPRPAARVERRPRARPAPASAPTPTRTWRSSPGCWTGELEHKDSEGNHGELYPGPGPADERRHGHLALGDEPVAATEDVHFVQMWVLPDTERHRARLRAARHQRRARRGRARADRVRAAATTAAISIRQRDAVLWGGRLQPGEAVARARRPARPRVRRAGAARPRGRGGARRRATPPGSPAPARRDLTAGPPTAPRCSSGRRPASRRAPDGGDSGQGRQPLVVGHPPPVRRAQERRRDDEVGGGPVQATGMFQTTAIRSSAFTSGSCGRGWSGSQKKIRKSISPSAMRAPICWSPPRGPLWSTVTSRPSSSRTSAPVVAVAYRVWAASTARLNVAHSSRSRFRWSWATRRCA